MNDPVSAARDLLVGIPVKVRRTIYGVLGLVILLDGIWNVLPDDISNPLVTTFGVFGSVLALANSGEKKESPQPVDRGGVPENFPGEFPS